MVTSKKEWKYTVLFDKDNILNFSYSFKTLQWFEQSTLKNLLIPSETEVLNFDFLLNMSFKKYCCLGNRASDSDYPSWGRGLCSQCFTIHQVTLIHSPGPTMASWHIFLTIGLTTWAPQSHSPPWRTVCVLIPVASSGTSSVQWTLGSG